jgi:hypothetical protein
MPHGEQVVTDNQAAALLGSLFGVVLAVVLLAFDAFVRRVPHD